MTYIFYICKYWTQYYICIYIHVYDTYVHVTHVLKIYISIYICAMCIYVRICIHICIYSTNIYIYIFAYKHIHHIIMIFLSHFFTEVLLIPNTIKKQLKPRDSFLKATAVSRVTAIPLRASKSNAVQSFSIASRTMEFHSTSGCNPVTHEFFRCLL